MPGLIHRLQDYLLEKLPSPNPIAMALSDSLFPQGATIKAPDNSKIVNQVNDLLKSSQTVDFTYGGLLWGLELHSLLICGRGFSQLQPSERATYLARYADTPLFGNYLRLLSLPLKFAYLNNDSIASQLNAKHGVRVPSEVEKHRWQQQVIDVDDYEPIEEIEVDVVVIGTGAGGAAAAYELASHGLAVLVLEEGRYLDRKDFTGKIPDMVHKLYRANGATGAIGSTLIPIPIGRNVGGTTTINSGTCVRTPDQVLAQWQHEGLTEFSKATMEPYFNRVEEVLQVQPADAKYVGEILKVIDEGASEIMADKGHLLPRNAVGCDGQGLCQFGCPTGAKQSTNVSFIPRALEKGALLMTGFRADQINWEGDQVVGVKATGFKHKEGSKTEIPLSIKTRHLVVAMGSLLTPLFLQQNGVKNKQLGRNLSIHPAGAVTAHFKDRSFDHSQLIPQGYGVTTLASKGLLFEGATPPLLAYGMLLPSLGEQFVQQIERYPNTAFFGFMIKDQTRGKVRKGLIKDIPLVTYNMNQEDFRLFLEGISTLAKMYLAAGADEVRIAGCSKKPVIRNLRELDELLQMKLSPRDFLISAFHPLGTARIGRSTTTAVCDADHQVFGKSGLYVMDGSAVPSSLGANPQVTIMALATKAAETLSKRILASYEA